MSPLLSRQPIGLDEQGLSYSILAAQSRVLQLLGDGVAGARGGGGDLPHRRRALRRRRLRDPHPRWRRAAADAPRRRGAAGGISPPALPASRLRVARAVFRTLESRRAGLLRSDERGARRSRRSTPRRAPPGSSRAGRAAIHGIEGDESRRPSPASSASFIRRGSVRVRAASRCWSSWLRSPRSPSSARRARAMPCDRPPAIPRASAGSIRSPSSPAGSSSSACCATSSGHRIPTAPASRCC